LLYEVKISGQISHFPGAAFRLANVQTVLGPSASAATYYVSTMGAFQVSVHEPHASATFQKGRLSATDVAALYQALPRSN